MSNRRVAFTLAAKARTAAWACRTATTCRRRGRWPSCRSTSSRRWLSTLAASTPWRSQSMGKSSVGVSFTWFFSPYGVHRVGKIRFLMGKRRDGFFSILHETQSNIAWYNKQQANPFWPMQIFMWHHQLFRTPSKLQWCNYFGLWSSFVGSITLRVWNRIIGWDIPRKCPVVRGWEDN